MTFVCCALLSSCIQHERILLTEPVHRYGERSLILTGTFLGQDSAYVQVYHDGQEIAALPFEHTWTLTLGEHWYYVIKFTDTLGRSKYLYIMELGDDMAEFYPPIDIDFETVGNLALIKARTGKPDWMELDVGMSRKRP